MNSTWWKSCAIRSGSGRQMWRVENDGNRLDVVTIHGIDPEELGMLGTFTVSPGDSRTYFLNLEGGVIYQAEWPF